MVELECLALDYIDPVANITELILVENKRGFCECIAFKMPQAELMYPQG